MKKIVATILLLPGLFLVHAQLSYLRLSPSQKIEQKVGATDLTLEFSRPSAKGRTIFGELVPYDKLWRTGANENTKITFSHKVRIGEKDVEAGTYALFTKPGPKEWEVYFYNETHHFDAPKSLEEEKIAAQLSVPALELNDLVETLTINVYDITETAATVGLSWEKTRIEVPIQFYTREAMEKLMTQSFSKNSFELGVAAIYYLERDIEMEKAKELQELSMSLSTKPSSWAYNTYAKILYKLDELDEAIKALNQSLALAEDEKNTFLIQENKHLLKEWTEGE